MNGRRSCADTPAAPELITDGEGTMLSERNQTYEQDELRAYNRNENFIRAKTVSQNAARNVSRHGSEAVGKECG